ncbi:histone deacetylase [Algiphilus sp.]|uniref:histone deacetylase family protein n=1 Tax=Algiphilus sp. TaxID=1872431 RepID=UPI0025BE12AA|nr:histone deacetylase [Algiphilus sp.]MBY8964337.1 histone deacetylase [Algiphilus acroporae]MCI5061932.1 histone deacetylase [Algiphilus sp.]MCI5102896.1 histone deacetylase [Algiphilus sp.]MCR9091759.1 histone deacetylase [Pseudomonadota bacterium]
MDSPFPGSPLLHVVHDPGYDCPLPAGHPFPMAKFTHLRRQLENAGGACFHAPRSATSRQLESSHAAAYLEALATGTLDAKAQRRAGFLCTPELFARCALETGGTCRTVELALVHGLACNAAGGTHHAHFDFASGYCLLNDLAVAVHHARELGVRRVLILDCDVHQGDGTARLLHDDRDAFTVSMHCAQNFPSRKAASDCDIGLPRETGDGAYLQALHAHVPHLLDRFQPELVLYDAGVDVHRDDRLGHFLLSDAGLYRRDAAVIEMVREREVPLACVIGGGYDRDIAALAARHALLFAAARDALAGRSEPVFAAAQPSGDAA